MTWVESDFKTSKTESSSVTFATSCMHCTETQTYKKAEETHGLAVEVTQPSFPSARKKLVIGLRVLNSDPTENRIS